MVVMGKKKVVLNDNALTFILLIYHKQWYRKA